ncbi:hypothetical protein GCM10010344_57510 [Streptomyces bluensis]|nr:hypothetical protein GCM10010344_57510 [Streptomyces bluensis]
MAGQLPLLRGDRQARQSDADERGMGGRQAQGGGGRGEQGHAAASSVLGAPAVFSPPGAGSGGAVTVRRRGPAWGSATQVNGADLRWVTAQGWEDDRIAQGGGWQGLPTRPVSALLCPAVTAT